MAESSDFDRLTGGLRVALVHDWLTGMRGGEKVLEQIADLFPQAPIYSLFAFEERISERLRRHSIRTSRLQSIVPRRLLSRYYRYLLPTFPYAIEDLDLTPYDLVISTSHCVAKGIIPAPGALHLCYCHSPMRYAWDLEQHYFPNRSGVLASLRGHLLSRLRTWDSASSPRVDGFWANSSWVAQRIERYYGRSAEVLAPPVDVDSFSFGEDLATGSGAPFALAVSALVPYKKLDLAIQACEQRGLTLCIVGSGPEEKRLRRLSGPHTQLLGRVDDETLRRLYREASFFLQPGVEDFGIAAVEALASGTPVVAIERGGVRDIVTDGVHGVLYSGFGVDHIVAAIDKFLKIRFNALELETQAQSFSTGRFIRHMKSSIVRQWNAKHARTARPREPQLGGQP